MEEGTKRDILGDVCDEDRLLFAVDEEVEFCWEGVEVQLHRQRGVGGEGSIALLPVFLTANTTTCTIISHRTDIATESVIGTFEKRTLCNTDSSEVLSVVE